MFKIMLKDLRKSTVPIVGFIILSLSSILLFNSFIFPRYSDELYVRIVTYPLLLGVLISICAYAVFLNSEKYENKNDGYKFLDMLPIKKSEIFKGKILAILVLNIIGIGFLVLINTLVNIDTTLIPLNNNMILLFACTGQIIVTVLIYLIFKLPFNRVYALGYILYLLQLLIPQLIPFLLVINDKKDSMMNLTEDIQVFNMLIPVIITLLILGLFFTFSFRNVKKWEPL